MVGWIDISFFLVDMDKFFFRARGKSFLFVQGAILLSGESAYYGGFLKGGATSLRKSSYSFPFLPTRVFEFFRVSFGKFSEARWNDKIFISLFSLEYFFLRIESGFLSSSSFVYSFFLSIWRQLRKRERRRKNEKVCCFGARLIISFFKSIEDSCTILTIKIME